jgi:flagellum-specific peptidoglycan hydrolase FlgJ
METFFRSSAPLWIARAAVTAVTAGLVLLLVGVASEPETTNGRFSVPLPPDSAAAAVSLAPVPELLRSLADGQGADARLRAAERLVEATAQDFDDTAHSKCLREIAPTALAAAAAEGVLPSLLLVQAAHESGWGQSRIAQGLGNLYGQAREGGCREFPSWAASVVAQARLLGRAERYASARTIQEWQGALGTIAPAYAEDPGYARRVGKLIEQWRLDRWDHLLGATQALAPRTTATRAVRAAARRPARRSAAAGRRGPGPNARRRHPRDEARGWGRSRHQRRRGPR